LSSIPSRPSSSSEAALSWELREQIWLSTFREAARNKISLVFTFAPENTVSPGFPAAAESIVRSEGGRGVLYVALRCQETELERRLSEPSRRSFGKLNSVDRYRELRDSGAFEFPPIRSDLALATGFPLSKAGCSESECHVGRWVTRR
jgi:hypothetical protein